MNYQFDKNHLPVITALIILLALSLYSTFESYQLSVTAVQDLPDVDMVTAWDRRLRRIRQILPDHGIIGYLADWDIHDVKFGSSDQEVEFLLAQYTVAPVILERGVDHNLILGNFNDSNDPTKMEKILNTFGITLLEPFSNEFSLFSGVKQ